MTKGKSRNTIIKKKKCILLWNFLYIPDCFQSGNNNNNYYYYLCYIIIIIVKL